MESRSRRRSHQTGVSGPTVRPAKSSCRVLMTMLRSMRATTDGTIRIALRFSLYQVRPKRRAASPRLRPVRNGIGRYHLIAGAPRYRDLDEVLIRWWGSAPMSQHFQHGRRIGCRGVDYFGTGLMPSAGDAAGAFRAPHRVLARGIADPIRAQRLRKGSRCVKEPCRPRPFE